MRSGMWTGGLPKNLLRSIAGSALALLCAAAAQADPVYSVTVWTCTVDTGTGPTSQFASTSRTNCGSAYYGSGAAQSGPHGIGANLELVTNNYFGSLGRSNAFEASADVRTEFMITGAPGSMVTASLNLDLISGIGGGVPGEFGTSTRLLEFWASLPGLTHYSFIRQVADVTTGITTTTSPGLQGVCSPCSVETLEFTVPANVWQPMVLRIALSLSGGGNSVGEITALDTLYFPLNGAVFNLPDGYSAEIAGLNVVGNRVVSTNGTAPEPGTLALLGLGLAGLAAARRRRQ